MARKWDAGIENYPGIKRFVWAQMVKAGVVPDLEEEAELKRIRENYRKKDQAEAMMNRRVKDQDGHANERKKFDSDEE